jgi:hypothetical protein
VTTPTRSRPWGDFPGEAARCSEMMPPTGSEMISPAVPVEVIYPAFDCPSVVAGPIDIYACHAEGMALDGVDDL